MRAKGPSPYFQLPGTARAALGRWSEVFGGEVRIATYADFRRTDGPSDAVAHGQLAGDLELFAADAAEGETTFAATGLLFSLLGASDPATLTRWFEALSVDGTVLDPLQRRPWGDWDGQVRDAFGVTWLIGYEASALPGQEQGAVSAVRQVQVTFDCAEPERVARFWSAVLGYVVPPPPPGFADWAAFDAALPPEHQGSAFACQDPDGVGPRLFFQRVPEGKVVKNRVHLDVRVGTGLVGEERLAALDAESTRLVALGATQVRRMTADGINESCIVMQDVEGNEFCLD